MKAVSIFPLTGLLLTAPAVPAKGLDYKSRVNMKDASFHLQLPLAEAPGLELKYSSRSLFKGLFGRSWCSNLDLRIERLDDVRLALHLCDTKIPFAARRVSRWMASDNDYFESGLTVTGGETDQIEVTPTLYIRRRGEDTWVFGKDGILKSVKTAGFTAEKLAAPPKAGAASEILIQSLERHSKLKVEAGLARRLSPAVGRTAGARFFYTKERLEQIVPAQGPTMKFEYDAGGNITRVVAGPGKTAAALEVEYDRRTDRVLAVGSGNCRETFEYRNVTKGPHKGPFAVLETESQSFENCGSGPVLKSRVRFTFRELTPGSVALVSSVTDTPTGPVSATFDEATGAVLGRSSRRAPARMGNTLNFGGTQ